MSAADTVLDVAILGARPAGLAAAHQLLAHGRRVMVIGLETDPPPDDLAGPRPVPRIFLRGRLLSPENGEVRRNQGVLATLRSRTSSAVSRWRSGAPPHSLTLALRDTFGARISRRCIEPLAEKLLGLPCHAIPADWLSSYENLDCADPVSDFERAAQTTAANEKIRPAPDMTTHGYVIRSIAYDSASGLFRIETATADGGSVTVATRHLINTIPVIDLVNALTPRPISLPQARNIRYRSMIGVTIPVHSAAISSGEEVFIADPAWRACRLQVSAGRPSTVRLEYYCSEGCELWRASDADLIALARDELARMALADADMRASASVNRVRKAFPLHDADYRHNMAMVQLDLKIHYPTLHLIDHVVLPLRFSRDQVLRSSLVAVASIVGEACQHAAAVNGSTADCPSGPQAVARRLPAAEHETAVPAPAEENAA